MPLEHFRNKEDYRKWTAYRHMHDIPAPHLKRVSVGGKVHTVKHSRGRRTSKRMPRPARRKGGRK
jgi:hypothetical protein